MRRTTVDVKTGKKTTDIITSVDTGYKPDKYAEIKRLEALETPRRIAEATLGTVLIGEALRCGDATLLQEGSTGVDWLQYNRNLIATERSKL